MEIDLRFKDNELSESGLKVLKSFQDGDINLSELLEKIKPQFYNVKIVKSVFSVQNYP